MLGFGVTSKGKGVKYRALAAFFLLILQLLLTSAHADSMRKVNVYFFWGRGCPHCADEAKFLETLRARYPELEVKSFEVWSNQVNARLLVSAANQFGITAKGVPMTFIGHLAPISGYLNDGVTGKLIEERLRYCIEQGCEDPIRDLAAFVEPEPSRRAESPPGAKEEQAEGVGAAPAGKKQRMQEAGESQRTEPLPPPAASTETGVARGTAPTGPGPRGENLVTIPLVGARDATDMSLPALTVVLAALDSFNPCAFFVLFTLLGILVHARSRTRMLIIGGTFVFFSGFIYFIFMSAWLNIFLYVGKLMVITVIAAAIALIIGVINIKDFFFFGRGLSLSIPEGAKPRLFDRMRNLLKASSTPSMLLGAVILSIAANTYELLCTVGFPMIFTRVLTLNNLETFQYYSYLVLYNVIYVIPLGAIVLAFSVTLGARKLSEKQGQVLKLVSGLMMLFLGIVLLVDASLFNNMFVGVGMLALALLTAWIIVRVAWRGERSGPEHFGG